ncbi:hypothetical protein [Bartonella sp. B39]
MGAQSTDVVWELVLKAVVFCCIAGVVLYLADERVAGWGCDALFVVIEWVGV